MLRGIEEVDGPGVYIRSICDALFKRETDVNFYVYYMYEKQAGRYSSLRHVTERVLPSRSKLLWDQVYVPLRAARDDLDVLFHHKFTIPLVSPCPTVVQQRGAEYWTHPQWYGVLERWHAKIGIPMYCASADRVVTNSRSLSDQLNEHIGIPATETDHIYAAADESFRPVQDSSRLNEVREKYKLPEQPFFLMVAKGYSSATVSGEEHYPRKNVQTTIDAHSEAWESLGAKCPPLVVAGPGFDEQTQNRYLRGVNSDVPIKFPGLVDFDDMPSLYSLARALVFPSYSESFGIPIVEAMACACPVIVSNSTACPEVVGDAGILVDPNSTSDITCAIVEVATRVDYWQLLREKALSRSREFSWEKSAAKLVSILREVAAG